MEKLSIEKTQNTPEILLDPDAGIVNLTGKSYPENSSEIYGPVMSWLREYFDGNAQSKTIVNLGIDYFNSSSSRCLYEFFGFLHEASMGGNEIEVNWIYDEEDDSSEEDGESFQEDFEALEIQLVKKKDF